MKYMGCKEMLPIRGAGAADEDMKGMKGTVLRWTMRFRAHKRLTRLDFGASPLLSQPASRTQQENRCKKRESPERKTFHIVIPATKASILNEKNSTYATTAWMRFRAHKRLTR